MYSDSIHSQLDKLSGLGIHIDTRGPYFTVNFGVWARGNFPTMTEAIDYAFSYIVNEGENKIN